MNRYSIPTQKVEIATTLVLREVKFTLKDDPDASTCSCVYDLVLEDDAPPNVDPNAAPQPKPLPVLVSREKKSIALSLVQKRIEEGGDLDSLMADLLSLMSPEAKAYDEAVAAKEAADLAAKEAADLASAEQPIAEEPIAPPKG